MHETVSQRLEEEGSWSEVVAVPSILIFSVLAKVKLYLARELESTILWEDGICSALVEYWGSFIRLVWSSWLRHFSEGTWLRGDFLYGTSQ